MIPATSVAFPQQPEGKCMILCPKGLRAIAGGYELSRQFCVSRSFLEGPMTSLRSALVISGAFLLATVSSGHAQDASWVPYGLYLRGDAGLAFSQKTTFKDTAPTSALTTLGTTTEPSKVGMGGVF